MLTAMRAVENVMTGSKHDLWAVNAERRTTRSIRSRSSPYKRVPDTQYVSEPLRPAEEAAA